MIILASQSSARRNLLERAGVTFKVHQSSFDEESAKAEMVLDPATLALRLAQGKALAAAKSNPDSTVVAADQVLHANGLVFHKPSSLAEAREQLLQLRGKTHHLVSAVACARNSAIVWQHSESAELAVRDFSDAFLENYLQVAGDAICHSVGAYHYEGIGIRLMERVTGSDHTILGLPLLPLLSFLRAEGLLET